MLEKFDKYDKHFPDGVFVEPKETKEPKVRLRALSPNWLDLGCYGTLTGKNYLLH
jgi:hypothetical protein